MSATTTIPKTMILPSEQDSTGRTLGAEEQELVCEAIRTGTLTSTKGNFVKTLETDFAKMYGVPYAHACSSGSAAVHLAVAAINPEPGDEIITTSITDMGALTPIMYQAAIPVFADVDPVTCNITAEAIERVISPKTKAIIVTHLFGNPCDMTSIMQLARARNIPVIEDCAQAFLAKHKGELVGTLGDIGCFSLQQGKHITTGEGGLVISRNAALARHMFLFINKAWGYGDTQPDHYFLALNYRMTELHGAVAVAQLKKLEFSVRQRVTLAARLSNDLAGIAGIDTPRIASGDTHTFWKYCLTVDGSQLPGGAVALAARLKLRGIACAPRYIQKPAFQCEVFTKQRTFGNSRFPFNLARPEAVDYSREKFPGTYAGLEGILVLAWSERYTEEHVQFLAHSIREAVEEVRSAK